MGAGLMRRGGAAASECPSLTGSCSLAGCCGLARCCGLTGRCGLAGWCGLAGCCGLAGWCGLAGCCGLTGRGGRWLGRLRPRLGRLRGWRLRRFGGEAVAFEG